MSEIRESHDHVFLKCKWVKELKDKVMVSFPFDQAKHTMEKEVQQMCRVVKNYLPMVHAYDVV